MVIRGLIFTLLAYAVARASTSTDDGTRLYESHDFTGAEAAFRHAVSEEPDNAQACHYLGMSIVRSAHTHAFEEAIPWLEHAANVAGNDAGFFQDYGETSFFAAREEHSLFYALRGRNALKRAVEIDGDALDARAMLMEFYARAPWPLGNHKEALVQASAIAARNPSRGIASYLLIARIFEEKDNLHAATQACREVLKLDPSNSAASALELHLETL